MRDLYGDPEKEDEDERLQREVLAFVLVEHPVPMPVEELGTELGRGADIDGAIEALVADGLVVRRDQEVVPTPAAIHFHLLEPIDPPRID